MQLGLRRCRRLGLPRSPDRLSATFGRYRLQHSQAAAAADDGEAAVGLPLWPTDSKPVYITTPIFYVNGDPHVGHLYTVLLGDALARWYRDVRSAPTFLAVGTDEHGLKVQQAAAAAGQPTEQYAAARSATFRNLFDKVGISYDRFVRTSEPAHVRCVSLVWRQLAAAGHIRRGEHAGWCARKLAFTEPCVHRTTIVPSRKQRDQLVSLLSALLPYRYCVADETFVPDAQVILNPSGERVSAESGRTVEWACEDNFLFQLRKQLPALREWVDTYPKFADQIQGPSDCNSRHVGDDGIEDEYVTPDDESGVSSGWKRRITPAGAAGWVDAALRADLPCRVVASSEEATVPTDTGGTASCRGQGGAGVAEELSVSRPASRVSWGISVPDDPDHTVYVWLDALSNYLTVAVDYDAGIQKRASATACKSQARPASEMDIDIDQDLNHLVDELTLWPPDHQIVGKDILKFHSIYWPAFLAAAGIPLPERLHAHAHWQAHDGAKMSKTSGNVVSPDQLIATYGIEATRYYLLRDGPQGSKDSHFDEEMLITRCNSDLANTLGNLLTRATAPKMCPEQAWPCFPDGPSLIEDEAEGELQRLVELKTLIDSLPSTVDGLMRQGRVGTATARIMKLLSMANAHFQANQPWADKSGTVGGQRDRAIWCALESLRVSLILLQPILPESARRGLDMIGVPQGADSRCGPEVLEFGYVNHTEEEGCAAPASRAFVKPGVLFARLERAEP